MTEQTAGLARVSMPAPDFTMPSTKNLETLKEAVRLSDYRGKWLVMFFYPLDFTFVCPTEIRAFSEAADTFRKAGAEILGVSTDSVHSHRAWIKAGRDLNGLGEIHFPLASDLTREVSRRYGVLKEEEGIALRGLFIIDPKGILQYQVIHNLGVGRSTDETLRVLRAFQTGELCPANWKPGQAPLKI
ncbi:MAG TPA: peroxiredoxin [Candidatus Polarisedimenticolia bacterium]|nr:peroxiredoxin [Candidatus Polarisedimenticolia bacterium]